MLDDPFSKISMKFIICCILVLLEVLLEKLTA